MTTTVPPPEGRPTGAALVFASAITAWAAATIVATVASPFGADATAAAMAVTASAASWALVVLRPPPSWVVGAVGVSGGTVVVWSAFAWIAGGDPAAFVSGPFRQPNSLGAVAATTAVLSLAAATWRPVGARATAVAAVVGAVVSGQALLRSGSMGALLAAAVGLGALGIRVWSHRGRRALGRLVAATAIAAFATLALGLVAAVALGARFDTTTSTGFGVDAENHATEHLTEWEAAIRVWLRNPLAGAGPRRFPDASREVANLDPARGFDPSGYEDARSDSFTILAEGGIVGAAAWMVAVGAALWAALAGTRLHTRISPHADAGDPSGWVDAATGGFVVVAVYGLVDVTAAVPMLLAFTIALGSVCTAPVIRERGRALPAAPAGSAHR